MSGSKDKRPPLVADRRYAPERGTAHKAASKAKEKPAIARKSKLKRPGFLARFLAGFLVGFLVGFGQFFGQSLGDLDWWVVLF